MAHNDTAEQADRQTDGHRRTQQVGAVLAHTHAK